tara:strand:- start:19144 stop:19446 length:303 start_codon:yes stop_codon:yes gene_type:complete
MDQTLGYRMVWEGITISIKHTPQRWNVIDHIEIRSVKPERAPLPITETGYKSHFIQEEYLNEYGGAEGFVLAWLEHEAKTPAWKTRLEKSKQFCLFPETH